MNNSTLNFDALLVFRYLAAYRIILYALISNTAKNSRPGCGAHMPQTTAWAGLETIT